MTILYSLESILSMPYIGRISCGFPSPADDHLDEAIDLNREYIKNKSSTYFGRVSGDSMIDAGLENGDLLIIDKSLKPKHGNIAVCFLDGDFTVKRIRIVKGKIWLMAENKNYQPIEITPDNELMIWGIVVHSVKNLL
jgi:DNA polymerase V